ncbi:MAG: terminase family protein [Clostridia bacterium]|nr:terminase family protein [Clostridia bacterium]
MENFYKTIAIINKKNINGNWRIMREKDILFTLLSIEKEQMRRKAGDKLARYNTGEKVHQKQIDFHKCLKRNRWVFGGNRSGKTECGAVEAVWWARGIHPYRLNRKNVSGWIVSLSYEVQREVAQSKFLSYLNPDWIEDVVMLSGKKGSAEYGIIDYVLIKNVFGGTSKVAFKSCDQGREKFQGASLDFVWFDEEPPKDVYDECRMRVIDRVGEVWGTMTPLKGLTWVYDEIYLNSAGDDEVWHEHVEWADNPFLDKKEVASLSANMDEQTLSSRRYGRFCEAEGIVYKEFQLERDVIEPFDVPFEWQDEISIDPGLNNPLACLFFATDYDGNVYVVGEWYMAGKDIDYHAEHIKDLAYKLNWHTDGKGRLTALIDSAADQHTLASRKSVSELFYDRGILVNTNVDKQLFSGIASVKSYFAEGKIKIFSTCVNLIRELKSYWWGKGDKPIKKDDHALDALRYYIVSKPQPARLPKTQVSEIQKDKRRLINARNNLGKKIR